MRYIEGGNTKVYQQHQSKRFRLLGDGKQSNSSDGRKDCKSKEKSEEIIRILQGKRMNCICMTYLAMIAQIHKMAEFRPQRSGRTDLLYYYRPAGTGKTTSIEHVKYLQ